MIPVMSSWKTKQAAFDSYVIFGFNALVWFVWWMRGYAGGLEGKQSSPRSLSGNRGEGQAAVHNNPSMLPAAE